jgi:PHP family Zn ribbon phosphoesterase
MSLAPYYEDTCDACHTRTTVRRVEEEMLCADCRTDARPGRIEQEP